MTFTAVIPAREGSKGLPGKNTKILGSLPLWEHSVLLALSLPMIENIIVSTDCKSILECSSAYPSVYFLHRPCKISGDSSNLVDVVAHAIETILSPFSDVDYILLQPTSPYRSSSEIALALEKYSSEAIDSMIAVCQSSQHPYEAVLKDQTGFSPIIARDDQTQRQQYPESYFITGSFYISSYKMMLRHADLAFNPTYFITKEPYCIDIDTEEDFELAQLLYPIMLKKGYASFPR